MSIFDILFEIMKSIKIGLCEDFSLVEESKVSVEFQSQCNGSIYQDLILDRGMKTEFFELNTPIPMENLHKMVLQWHGRSALCFTDLILLADNSKIQLLESFPRDKNLVRFFITYQTGFNFDGLTSKETMPLSLSR